MPCTPGSAANDAGTLLGGARRLHAPDGSEVHHHLGVSGFATRAVVDRRSVVPVEELVSSRIALDDVNAGMDDLAAGRAVRQVIEVAG